MPETPDLMPDQDVYTVAEFAKKVRLSVDQVKDHISGELPPLLEPFYSGTKALITEDERRRWIAAAPKEPTRRSSAR